ncbi:ABC transporter substrate-binding protein [Neoactinobaculum massilliense]|uniref:ABC transporter substrate-binding protein n=1 Tax=Neoactinobaculum massilliense TaxID=2364794 RepID=UPI000F54A33A|nr:extracellular solute-binding protein [Neoactinobaculum massilliense]
MLQCWQVAQHAQVPAVRGGGDTEITYFSYHGEEITKPIVAEFEKENPDVSVKVTYGNDPQEYVQTLQTRIAGNNTPDVFVITLDNRNDIMNAGAALDLSGKDFLSGLPEKSFDLYSRDGKVYGMPTTAWFAGLVYNKDLLKASGYSSVPTDLSDFITMCQKLKADGVPYPFLDETDSIVSGTLQALIASYQDKQGLLPMDESIDTGESTVAKTWKPALEQYQKLIKDGVVTKENVTLPQDQIVQAFLSGQAAVYRTGPWDYTQLSQSGINFGVSAFPAYPGGSAYVNGGPDGGYAISASASKDKQAAAERFLAFLNSAKGIELTVKGTGGTSLSDNYTSRTYEQFQPVATDYLLKGKYYGLTWSKASEAMTSEALSQQQLLIQGQTTPAEMADTLQSKWESVSK